MVIIFAEDSDIIDHLAEYTLLLGVKFKNVPPGLGHTLGNSLEVWAWRSWLNLYRNPNPIHINTY